jgi:hypothetical protein
VPTKAIKFSWVVRNSASKSSRLLAIRSATRSWFQLFTSKPPGNGLPAARLLINS